VSEAYSDRPGPERKPSSSSREDYSEESDRPKLGSLAQSARGKQLNQARGILIVIGILTIVVNGIFLALAREQTTNSSRSSLNPLSSNSLQGSVVVCKG
jgi:hypothetical protein